MQCKVQWRNKFIADQFTKKWLNSNADDGYRTHTKKIALEREKSKIPETLLEIPKRAARKAQLEVLDDLRKQERLLKSNLRLLNKVIIRETPEIVKTRLDLTTLAASECQFKQNLTPKEIKEKEKEFEKL